MIKSARSSPSGPSAVQLRRPDRARPTPSSSPPAPPPTGSACPTRCDWPTRRRRLGLRRVRRRLADLPQPGLAVVGGGDRPSKRRVTSPSSQQGLHDPPPRKLRAARSCRSGTRQPQDRDHLEQGRHRCPRRKRSPAYACKTLERAKRSRSTRPVHGHRPHAGHEVPRAASSNSTRRATSS